MGEKAYLGDATDIRRVVKALEMAQEIAIKATNTPASSDPRWAEIAGAVELFHADTCSIFDAGACNCWLS